MFLLFEGERAAADTVAFVEEKVGIGLWTLDFGSGRMQWSSGLYALLGIEPGSVEPSLDLLQSMIHPEDRLSRQDVDRNLQAGIPISREFRIIRGDGRIRWVANRGEVVMNRSGQRERAVGVIYNVSAQQNALIELHAIEQRYRTLTRGVATIIWTAPPDGQMTDLPEWRELTGQTLSEFQGSGWQGSLHPDDRDAVAQIRARSIATQSPYAATYRIKLKDGSYRWFNSRAVPVKSETGEVKEWIGILIDVFQGTREAQETCWLTGAQARAARAILNWTIRDIADAAGVSVSTIRRLEENDARPSLRDDILEAIRAAYEDAGIEFIFLPVGEPAVRPRRHFAAKERPLRLVSEN